MIAKLMFTTSACTATAYRRPSRNHGSWIELESLTTLIGTTSASGATPTVPTPFAVAAMIPATWVPWEKVTVGPGVTGSPGTNDRARAALMFGARSGCDMSKFRSSTATRAPAPVYPASQANLALIACSPHWKGYIDSSAGRAAGLASAAAPSPSAKTWRGTFGTTEETPGISAAAVWKSGSDDATRKVPIS